MESHMSLAYETPEADIVQVRIEWILLKLDAYVHLYPRPQS